MYQHHHPTVNIISDAALEHNALPTRQRGSSSTGPRSDDSAGTLPLTRPRPASPTAAPATPPPRAPHPRFPPEGSAPRSFHHDRPTAPAAHRSPWTTTQPATRQPAAAPPRGGAGLFGHH